MFVICVVDVVGDLGIWIVVGIGFFDVVECVFLEFVGVLFCDVVEFVVLGVFYE